MWRRCLLQAARAAEGAQLVGERAAILGSTPARALAHLPAATQPQVRSARQTWQERSFATAQEKAMPSEQDLHSKDVYTILAEMMHNQAAEAKKQDALKKDAQNVVKMMEGELADIAELDFNGKLKDLLPQLSRKARSDLLSEFMNTEPLKNAQPALKDMMAQLQQVGEGASILRVATRYLELVEGKGGAKAAPVRITLTTATKEGPQDLNAKKAMLMEDMQRKGQLGKEQAVEWDVRVDPTIEGGVVFNIGDVMVDASYKALRDQFFHNLEQAGLPRVP